MRLIAWIHHVAVGLAAVGLILPPAPAQAADPVGTVARNPIPALAGKTVQATFEIVDVALGEENTLRGRVVDTQNQPVAAATVQLMQQSAPVAVAQSDESGQFAFHGVRGGAYQVVCGAGVCGVRAWTAATAPPSATSQMLLVQDGTVIRGQITPFSYLLSDPCIVLGLVGLAVGIPVVLNNIRSDRQPSS